MKYLVILVIAISILISCGDKGTNPTDPPNKADTVIIGNQIWMTKNLEVDHYQNGDEIPQVTDTLEWGKLKTGAWCYYNNDSTLGVIYGKLYNWYAVNDPRGLAPTGWHVPSNSEWTTLTNFLGGDSVAGGKLKETGTSHWLSPNTCSTNETGFSALPGGYRSSNGPCYNIGVYGYWWSSTELNTFNSWSKLLYYINTKVYSYLDHKGFGYSVRCVKNN